MIDYIAVFAAFFAVIDPIGTVPVFLAVTREMDPEHKPQVALKASLVAAGVLLFFAIAGQPILNSMSVPLPAFQIAGGIVLFIFAVTMIFGESKPQEEIRSIKDHRQTAVYPLAVPSMASPGAMLSAVLLTDNDQFRLTEQVQTMLVMIGVLFIAYGLMIAAKPIDRLIGESGASIVSRVMGLLLSAVATDSALDGIRQYFNL